MVSKDKRAHIDDPTGLPDSGETPAAGNDQNPASGSPSQDVKDKGQAESGDRPSHKPVKRRGHKVNRDDILDRLLEKNEVILQLTRKSALLDTERKDLKEKWLRSRAEFENYRKRIQKEWELLRQQSRAEVVLVLLNAVDDFERALAVAEGKDDDFVQGIRLIYSNLLSAMGEFGVKKMEALHQTFDPNLHMAVGQVESDEVPSNHVAEVLQEGYLMGDAVLRPARVIIAK